MSTLEKVLFTIQILLNVNIKEYEIL